MAVPRSLRSDRDTDAGYEAARRWLGLREHLQEDDIFCDLPPAAVAVWDRYIAYGAALDVSVAAVRELPLGSESEYEAWSSYGGSWHVVRVRYPRFVPPGWGRHPVLLFLISSVLDAAALFVLLKVVPTLLDERDRIIETLTPPGSPQVPAIENVIQIVAIVLTVASILSLIRSAVLTVLASIDMVSRREVDGRIVRIRTRPKKPPMVAVDDGKRKTVRAWVVRMGRSSGYLHPGNDVHATVSPLLGYVYRMEVTKEAVRGPAVHPQLADAMAGIEKTMDVLRFIPGFRGLASRLESSIATAGLVAATWSADSMTPMAGLDLAALSAAAGIQLSDVTAAEPATMAVAATGGPGEAAVLSDGNVGQRHRRPMGRPPSVRPRVLRHAAVPARRGAGSGGRGRVAGSGACSSPTPATGW